MRTTPEPPARLGSDGFRSLVSLLEVRNWMTGRWFSSDGQDSDLVRAGAPLTIRRCRRPPLRCWPPTARGRRPARPANLLWPAALALNTGTLFGDFRIRPATAPRSGTRPYASAGPPAARYGSSPVRV